MFSEYASRFLAQSQSRIALRPDELHTNSHDHRWRPQGNARFPTSRSFLQRTTGDPYQSATSQISNLPFAPRRFAQAAPLFYSATDEFREEDDEEEHEREIADFYALQRSRRHFGSSHLRDSLEVDGRGLADSDELQTFRNDRLSKGKGIRSSWRDEKASSSEGSNIQDELGSDVIRNRPKSPASRISSDMQGNLVDIGLDDTLRTDDFKRPHSPEFGDDEPPIQRFRGLGNLGVDSSFIATETDKQKLLDNPPPQSSTDSYPASGTNTPVEPPLHDAFWGQLFFDISSKPFRHGFSCVSAYQTPWRQAKLGRHGLHNNSQIIFPPQRLYSCFYHRIASLACATSVLRSHFSLCDHGFCPSAPLLFLSLSIHFKFQRNLAWCQLPGQSYAV